MKAVLLDTGPLVAYLEADDEHHHWAVAEFSAQTTTFLTCEAVLAEASHLFLKAHGTTAPLWDLLRHGIIRPEFNLGKEYENVAALMRRYSDIPMDLADACLVRMSELHKDCAVLTIDSDFKFYRRFNRQVIPLLSPAIS